MFGFVAYKRWFRYVVSTRGFHVICFLSGLLMVGAFSTSQIGILFNAIARIPGIIDSEEKSYAFSTRRDDWGACLQGVHDNPRGIVFTSGSSFRYSLDVDALSNAIDAPVVGCILNDHRLDAFTLLFVGSKQIRSEQVVVHGYNSWAVNSPGTWRGLTKDWHFIPTPMDKNNTNYLKKMNASGYLATQINRFKNTARLALLYAGIFISRTDAETPAAWRLNLQHKFSLYKNWDIAYWPLNKQTHQERRVELMKRWFDTSQWTRSFAIEMDRLQPREEIEMRHRDFFEALKPAHSVVLIPAPEMREIFPKAMQKVMSQSKAIMQDILITYPNVKHVDVDYDNCGLKPADFWIDSLILFDPVHPQPSTTTKVTECVIKGLNAAGMSDLVGQGH